MFLSLNQTLLFNYLIAVHCGVYYLFHNNRPPLVIGHSDDQHHSSGSLQKKQNKTKQNKNTTVRKQIGISYAENEIQYGNPKPNANLT